MKGCPLVELPEKCGAEGMVKQNECDYKRNGRT